jgi:hypothetical protein
MRVKTFINDLFCHFCANFFGVILEWGSGYSLIGQVNIIPDIGAQTCYCVKVSNLVRGQVAPASHMPDVPVVAVEAGS